jgi:hypothetical protein
LVTWSTDTKTRDLISKIADRAVALGKKYEVRVDHLSTMMDIESCHCNGNPLKLEELLAADDFNFQHDVFGIREHINHKTGEMEDGFLPRYSKQGG